MDGVLNLAKPKGPTSHDVIKQVRRAIGVKRVGHTGTLDPMAEGVLVVCIGKATRIAEYLVGCEKEYETLLVLGASTTTQDAEGEIVSTADASHITKDSVVSVLSRFTGSILQIPPMVSAVKHGGKRLYELARDNVVVHREPRNITVSLLEMTSFGYENGRPVVGLRVICSSGTYIRTLCSDIGDALGVGGYMAALVRTRVGMFSISDSITLEEFDQAALSGGVQQFIISMKDALAHLPIVVVNNEQAEKIANGITIPALSEPTNEDMVRICTVEGRLIAIGRIITCEESFLKPEKVFVSGIE